MDIILYLKIAKVGFFLMGTTNIIVKRGKIQEIRIHSLPLGNKLNKKIRHDQAQKRHTFHKDGRSFTLLNLNSLPSSWCITL